MSKKQTLKRRRPPPAPTATRPASDPGEHRVTEAMTVAWMMALLATLAADGLALLSWLAIAFVSEPKSLPQLVPMIPPLMLMIGAVTGFFCLLLTVVVLRRRIAPIPPSITATAIIGSLLPIVAAVVFTLK